MNTHDSLDSATTATRTRRGFFSRIDWASFWTATVLSFLVYFFTVAPSVTLEDAGELVTAGDHLGVPHPPGYPLWTVCAYLFARALSFVHYMGQPNPAWAIALMSGFFAALAAGITSMLITRSSADMLADLDPRGSSSHHALLSWIGGVAGSLVFAFSPVEWSQAAIPEVYTLNSLFLMWVFLLSYRWMRRPSDRVLWAVAFIFGLGLTNYQVLVFAIVPLVLIILFRDIALFRDLALTILPFLMTAGILMLGAEVSKPGFPKNAPYPGYEEFLGPPLANPVLYIAIALLLFAAAGITITVGLLRKKKRLSKDHEFSCAIAIGILAALTLILCLSAPTAAPLAVPPGYQGSTFEWGGPVVAFFGLLFTLWALAWFTPGGRWYASAITLIEVALAILLVKGCLLGLTHPLTGWFAFYCALNFLFLGLAWTLLPRGRAAALAALCAEAGVAFYGYMPLASDTNPPMNWGYPRTWVGFKHAISRGQYEKIAPTGFFDPLLAEQVGAYFSDLRKQFTLLLVPFGFLPFTVWSLRLSSNTTASTTDATGTAPKKSLEFRFFALAFGLSIAIAALAAIDRLWNQAEAFVPPQLFVAVLGFVLLCSGIGFAITAIRQGLGLLHTALDTSRDPSDRATSGLCLVGLTTAILVAVIGFSKTIATFHAIGSTPSPADYAAFHTQITISWILYSIFAIAILATLGFYASRRQAPLRVQLGETHQQWLLSTFVCFLVMSFLLIVLAAPKGDLQDNFIQKVKFISSHAIFSLWIGYGIAFGLALVARVSTSRSLKRLLFWPACILILLGAPLIPIYENYCNDQLVDEMSSASQDGHDFGWQFGNYQLRGAAAIAEELSSNEEPLPNPEFPPEMTPHAIFYGGTDPGRFVPTYMIFSADVRPDVFLITQNALADNTYMDTMRDMYGDQIWMPTQKDNANAFSEYVEDVRSGRRPNYGDISFEGGRVQVTGALAVMEINGILTEQIFKQNRDRHDFYVEESYTLRWMYPYETPHGLIMKIEHDPTPLTQRHLSNDTDFWDWYSRRLLATPKYKRDLTARKSFSKLRASIAGLYTARGRTPDAERAFREAVRLYPASPESNLRLVQEILMPAMRFSEALRLLLELRDLDPNNKRLPSIIDQVAAAESALQFVNAYGQNDPATLAPSIAIPLAESQLSLQRRDLAIATLRALSPRLAILTPAEAFRYGSLCNAAQLHREAAQAFASIPTPTLRTLTNGQLDLTQTVISSLLNGQRLKEADAFLISHLRDNRDDWRAWLELAISRHAQARDSEAITALEQARKIILARPAEQDAFIQMISANPTLSAFFQKAQPARAPAPFQTTPAQP